MFSAATERQVVRLLGVVCDITRVKIVRALQATPLAASDLARVIGRTRSATSQHLRVLREAGAVTPDRKGNVIRYRLDGSSAATLLEAVSEALDKVA
jgi:DNA-binding transcriptional ArsR family regulator